MSKPTEVSAQSKFICTQSMSAIIDYWATQCAEEDGGEGKGHIVHFLGKALSLCCSAWSLEIPGSLS